MAKDVDLTKLKPNTMIEGPMWNGPATFISAIPERGMLIIQHDGETKTVQIPSANHGIRPAAARGEPWRAFVAVERLRHEYARNLGTSGSADQLPHQLKTIYQVSGEPGRIRYLVADEPGGGKTVVASRIIQELSIQKQVRRALVVVPAMLKYQWQDELKRFVNMESLVIEGDVRGRANPWLSNDKPVLITSMDYAKQKTQMELLEQAEFDLVVVDEAHNLNATGKNVTGRYRLGELLGRISKHILFLTATPHRGKPENFRLLLKLLEPDLFSNPKMTDEDVYHTKNRLFIRHTKDDMVNMEGDPLFLKRSVKSVKYKMSRTEQDMYDEVTDYVNHQYAIQMGRDANRIATFAVLIIQKRMASSTRALLESLKRRRQKLGDRLKEWDGPVDDDATYDVDDMDEDEMEEAENEAAGYTTAQTADDLKNELGKLGDLIKLAEHTSKTKPDTKLERLISEIRGIGNDRLLIFSEYRDTLDYLQENIARMRRDDGSAYDTCRIDGTMKMADREAAQEAFRTHSQIMLATDAAREGINLQDGCHRMVNYDLPWTPISLEQRMGRLHRYGQKHEVVISNMVADGTSEGRVMDTLFEKIRQIELQYPTFNVMGQVLAGGDLEGLMTDAIRSGSADDIADGVNRAAERAMKVGEMLGHTPIDREDVERDVERVKAQRTDGEHLVRMVERLFAGLGGAVRHVGGKTRLAIPDVLRYGPLEKKSATHDVPPAELFARGGRMYGHLEGWIRQHCSDDLKFGSVFRDPGGFDGYVVFHTIPIHDKGGNRVGRLLAAHKYADGIAAGVDPYILHDMKYDNDQEAGPAPRMDDVEKAVRDMAHAEADMMAAERRKIWEHRTGAALRRMRAEVEEIRQERGRIGFGAERNTLDARYRELERRIAETNAAHETAVTLTPYASILEGWVRVVPDADGPAPSQPTEKIGMAASRRHELAEGFEVKDVSGQRNIGYDLLSTHQDGRRREIEVKARCDASCIELTESEYEHAKNGKHAIIHVINNAGRPDEELHVISDPSDIRSTLTTVHMVPQSEVRRLAD